MRDMERTLCKFLNAYWLRPETALWRTLDVESMNGFAFVSPSLDLGCGDGTFSFLRAGGAFTDSFDVFLDMDNLDRFFDNVDVYDAYHKRIDGENTGQGYIARQPDYSIDIGLDHKQNLMLKAADLKLYRQFIHADANHRLPFEDESFQTVFSNIIYWLNDPAAIFREIYRILQKNGTCCVMLPNTAYLESSFYYTLYIKGKREEFKFLKLIDRGRISDNLKIVKTYDGWKNIIEDAGLRIEACVPHLSKTLIKIWDIGLRPIFPILKKMADQIDKSALMDIKQEWVDLFLKIGCPIIENDSLLARNEEFCFFCFILRKS